VKLSDFGLARHVVESESLQMTQAGAILGTPLYMAPEQCMGAAVDQRTDVYAMGATLFHLLAGRPPFLAPTSLNLATMHCHEPPPPLQKFNPGVSDGACRLVERCLAKSPEARYPDAQALLHDLERLLRGEPASIAIHPRLPECDPRYVVSYDFVWELESSPADLWPHVSNTERLNRAVGLPAVQFSARAEPETLGGTTGRPRTRRFGRFRKLGFLAAWEEHPFEWIEGRRMGVLREYSKGPFRWLVSVVELAPRPGGGTVLSHRVRLQPRGLFGRAVAAVEVGFKGRRALDRVYRRIDAALTGKLGSRALADPFEQPAALSGARRRRLDALLDRLSERGLDPAVVERLGDFLATAADQEVARIRPLALARRLSLDPQQVVAACLHGAREGLLVLLWDILCPLCRIPCEIKDTLQALRDHGHCEACNLDFDLDFANAVEMIFRVHPAVRASELRTYCIGGPVHSPHVAAQVRVAPHECMELALELAEGEYRLRGPQLPFAFDFRVRSWAVTARWELNLASRPDPELPRSLKTGGQLLVLRNDTPQELLVRVERTASRSDALTAARASSLALFRELFPGELLSPGQLASVANVTLLVTGLDGADDLYRQLGDARAFGLIHHHLQLLEEHIRREGGALVKTTGAGVLATFHEATAAVRAGLSILAGCGMRVGDAAQDRELLPKVGVHRGPAMVATLNDHLDYFGTTVQEASALVPLACGGDLVLTQIVAADLQVASLLRTRGLEAEILQTDQVVQPGGILHRIRMRAKPGS
jgi:class 3 adenylate cyclase